MVRTIQAVYKNGVFLPLEPLGDMADQSHVDVTIDADRAWTSEALFSYGCLPAGDGAPGTPLVHSDLEEFNPGEW
jgi:predicted DNA-binding antitoxin AbrB/MazE fold protein